MAIQKFDGVVRSIEKCLIGNEDFSYITYKLKINAENCIQYYVEEADIRNKVRYVFAVDNWEDVIGSPVTICYDTEFGEVVKIGSDEEELWMTVKDLWNGEGKEPKTSEKEITDSINPQHYKMGAIEIIDCIKSELSHEEFKGYLKGNVIKYISREAHKNGFEDVEKGKWYMDRLAKEKSDGI